MTDKEIVDKLIAVRKADLEGTALFSNQGQGMDGYSLLANYNGIADDAIKARTIERIR